MITKEKESFGSLFCGVCIFSVIWRHILEQSSFKHLKSLRSAKIQIYGVLKMGLNIWENTNVKNRKRRF